MRQLYFWLSFNYSTSSSDDDVNRDRSASCFSCGWISSTLTSSHHVTCSQRLGSSTQWSDNPCHVLGPIYRPWFDSCCPAKRWVNTLSRSFVLSTHLWRHDSKDYWKGLSCCKRVLAVLKQESCWWWGRKRKVLNGCVKGSHTKDD